MNIAENPSLYRKFQLQLIHGFNTLYCKRSIIYDSQIINVASMRTLDKRNNQVMVATILILKIKML
jgi:hypothetical protein